MKKSPLKLKPTENQTFILAGNGDEGDLVRRLGLSHEEERRGDFRSACSERYEAFRLIVDVLPEDEAVELDRNHANTRAGLEIIYGSTIDNYLAGDFELAAAQAEMLLDCDPEDSMGATPTLALCYIALGEWDCFDDILPDLDDRSALHALLLAWASFVRTGKADAQALANLRRHRAVADELRAADHPTDDAYLRDISSERPSQAALARELWLRCEPVMMLYPEFAEELKRL